MSGVAVLIALHICTAFAVHGAAAGRRRKSGVKNVYQSIKWDSPYYRSEFRVCKQLRQMNPVEEVRARAYSTTLFRRCGPPLIKEYATKFNFPAFAIEKAAVIICLGITVPFAAYSIDGGTMLAPDTPSEKILAFVDALVNYIVRTNHTFVARFGRKRFNIPTRMTKEFISVLSRCAFNEPTMPVIDLDYIKHAVSYYKFILL